MAYPDLLRAAYQDGWVLTVRAVPHDNPKDGTDILVGDQVAGHANYSGDPEGAYVGVCAALAQLVRSQLSLLPLCTIPSSGKQFWVSSKLGDQPPVSPEVAQLRAEVDALKDLVKRLVQQHKKNDATLQSEFLTLYGHYPFNYSHD